MANTNSCNCVEDPTFYDTTSTWVSSRRSSSNNSTFSSGEVVLALEPLLQHNNSVNKEEGSDCDTDVEWAENPYLAECAAQLQSGWPQGPAIPMRVFMASCQGTAEQPAERPTRMANFKHVGATACAEAEEGSSMQHPTAGPSTAAPRRLSTKHQSGNVAWLGSAFDIERSSRSFGAGGASPGSVQHNAASQGEFVAFGVPFDEECASMRQETAPRFARKQRRFAAVGHAKRNQQRVYASKPAEQTCFVEVDRSINTDADAVHLPNNEESFWAGADQFPDGIQQDVDAQSNRNASAKILAGRITEDDMNVIKKLMLKNDFTSVSWILQSKGPPNRWLFNSIMTECSKANRVEAVMWLVDEMVRMNILPNIVTFNIVLNACAKSNNYMLSSMWWSRLSSFKLKPNEVTYNTMMSACSYAQRPEEAASLLVEMRQSGLSPCKMSFTAVITGFAKRGDAENAEKWLEQMRGLQLNLDLVLYNTFLHACAKAGDLKRAQRWTAQMLADGLSPNIRTYNSLIHACARFGKRSAANDLFNELKDAGLKPDLYTFGSLIDVCAKDGNVNEAELWMQQIYEEGLQPNTVCFNSMVGACALAGDLCRAEMWLAKLYKTGGEPSSVVNNYMIAVLFRHGEQRKLENMLAHKSSTNWHPDRVTFRTLRRVMGNEADVEENDKKLYCTIVRLYLQQNDLQRAIQWIRQDTLADGPPSELVVEVIEKLEATRRPQHAKIARELQMLLM